MIDLIDIAHINSWWHNLDLIRKLLWLTDFAGKILHKDVCEIVCKNIGIWFNFQFDKEKLDKLMKKLEAERDSITGERDAAVSEKQQLMELQQSSLSEKGSTQDTILQLQHEKQQLQTDKQQVGGQW